MCPPAPRLRNADRLVHVLISAVREEVLSEVLQCPLGFMVVRSENCIGNVVVSLHEHCGQCCHGRGKERPIFVLDRLLRLVGSVPFEKATGASGDVGTVCAGWGLRLLPHPHEIRTKAVPT